MAITVESISQIRVYYSGYTVFDAYVSGILAYDSAGIRLSSFENITGIPRLAASVFDVTVDSDGTETPTDLSNIKLAYEAGIELVYWFGDDRQWAETLDIFDNKPSGSTLIKPVDWMIDFNPLLEFRPVESPSDSSTPVVATTPAVKAVFYVDVIDQDAADLLIPLTFTVTNGLITLPADSTLVPSQPASTGLQQFAILLEAFPNLGSGTGYLKAIGTMNRYGDGGTVVRYSVDGVTGYHAVQTALDKYVIFSIGGVASAPIPITTSEFIKVLMQSTLVTPIFPLVYHLADFSVEEWGSIYMNVQDIGLFGINTVGPAFVFPIGDLLKESLPSGSLELNENTLQIAHDEPKGLFWVFRGDSPRHENVTTVWRFNINVVNGKITEMTLIRVYGENRNLLISMIAKNKRT